MKRSRAFSKEELLAKAQQPARDALRLHPFYRGKVQVSPKCAIRDFNDFAIWYTPGVAAPCKAIQAEPELVYEYTNKANTVAIVTDATRVLGLGDIGPEAGLPVMEGKALLFKYLGGVDAFPICLGTKDPDEIVRTVKLLEPAFGGINLEDIAQPKCFRILAALRSEMGIPVWHDDQQGTATVALAGVLNALEIVGKKIGNVRIAMIGMGAANVPTYRMLKLAGVDPRAIIACDRHGALHRGRGDVEARQVDYVDKWQVCCETNPERIAGGIGDILRGSDVCIAFSSSGPDIIKPEWVRGMASDAIVFACANPVPEIWPWDAHEAGARIVATGRSDFPNQLNNSLVFPGIFRGALDVRARTITDGMAMAAALELAACAKEAPQALPRTSSPSEREARTGARNNGLSEDRIVPRMDEWELYPREAVATAVAAQKEGVARVSRTAKEIHHDACERIGNARAISRLLQQEGLIPLAE